MTEFEELWREIELATDIAKRETCGHFACTTCGGVYLYLKTRLPEEDRLEIRRILSSMTYSEWQEIPPSDVKDVLASLSDGFVYDMRQSALKKLEEEERIKRLKLEETASSMSDLEAIKDWQEDYQFRYPERVLEIFKEFADRIPRRNPHALATILIKSKCLQISDDDWACKYGQLIEDAIAISIELKQTYLIQILLREESEIVRNNSEFMECVRSLAKYDMTLKKALES